MARRGRSFKFDNKSGQLEVAGKTVIDSENNDNIVSTTGSATGNAVQVTATGDDTDIDLRISAKGAGNIELRSTVELLSGKRIIDSAGTKVEFGDVIDMNSNKITEVGTPTASTDAATKGYVDTYYLPLTGGTVSSNLTISGNLTVSGTTTTVNSETITLADNIIELNSNASGTPTENAGITVNRGSSADVTLRWNETSDVWEMTTDGTTYQTIGSLASSDTDDLSEGSSNLYYTDTRARAAFSAGTGVSISSGTVSIGQSVGTSDSVTFSTVTANLTGTASNATTAATLTGLTSTVAELNILDGVTATAAELNYIDGVTSNVQTQLDAKLSLSGGTMTGAIAMGSSKITGVADPTSAQDAATKAYVDSSLSSVITVTDGTNSTALGDGSTLTFSGTANEVTVAESGGTVTIGLPSTITANLTGTASNATIAGTLSGLSATVTELNYVDGVTSNVQTQLDTKAPAASPTLTGTPLAPTAAAGTNTTQIATTAFVSTAVSNLVDSAPTTLDTLNELAAALGDDANFSTTVTNSLATKLPLAGGSMTGALTLNAQNQLRFADADSNHYVGFKAPATVSSDIMWTLPSGDGTEGQVLSTTGTGTLEWADPGSGGGSGSSYPNSTFSTVPGTNGDFDLSYNVAQTSQETPFEASGTDAFGVNLGSVYSMMDPVGSTDSLDLGAFT